MLRKRRGSSQVMRGGEDRGVSEAIPERIQKLATSSGAEEEKKKQPHQAEQP
jgi:hypothetical protein